MPHTKYDIYQWKVYTFQIHPGIILKKKQPVSVGSEGMLLNNVLSALLAFLDFSAYLTFLSCLPLSTLQRFLVYSRVLVIAQLIISS